MRLYRPSGLSHTTARRTIQSRRRCQCPGANPGRRPPAKITKKTSQGDPPNVHETDHKSAGRRGAGGSADRRRDCARRMAAQLRMAWAQDATGLDPHKQTAFSSLRLLELIYEPLVRLDPSLNVVPAIADSWEFSADGLTLTFKLNPNAKFSDGAQVTSADVKASFERLLDEETAAAARSNFLSIASIDTPDATTVVFNLSQPDAPILVAMATINAADRAGQRDRREHHRDHRARLGSVQARLVGPERQGSARRQRQLGRRQGRASTASPSRCCPTRPRSSPRSAPARPTSRCSTIRWSRRWCPNEPNLQLNRQPGPRLQRAAAQPGASADGRPEGPPGDLVRRQPPGHPRHRADRRRQGHRPADHAGLCERSRRRCSATRRTSRRPSS